MSYYTGLGAFAQGVVKGLDQYKQDTKEAEQRTYDRNRQSVADQQSAETHTAQIKNNDQTFKFNSIKLGQAERDEEDSIKKRDGQQHFAKLYGMRQNGDVAGMLSDINARIKPSLSLNGTQQLKYDQNEDGTISLNVYDPKDTTKPIKTHVTGLSDDDVFSRARFLYDPDGALESHLTNQAEASKSANKVKEELAIMAGKQPYEMERISAQAINTQKLALLNNNLGYQRDRANWDDRAATEAYKVDNKPQVAGKAGTLTPAFPQQMPSGMTYQRFAEQMAPIVAQIESGGNNSAVSPKGARGRMQIMPATRNEILKETGIDAYSSPEASMQAGTYYLAKKLKETNGDTNLALAAYNAGFGNVQKYGGVPPFRETQDYIQRFHQAAGTVDQSKQTTANAIGSNVAPTAKWVSEAFAKDSESGITSPKVMGTLQQASGLLTKAANSNDPNQKRALYTQAGDVVNMLLANSNLTIPEKAGLRDRIMVDLTGSNSLAQVGNGMGFGQQPVQQQDTRAQQREQAKTVPNKFNVEDEALYSQVMGVGLPPPAQKNNAKVTASNNPNMLKDTLTYLSAAPKPNRMSTAQIQKEAGIIQQVLGGNPSSGDRSKLNDRLDQLKPFMPTNIGSVPNLAGGVKSAGSSVKSALTLKIPTMKEIRGKRVAQEAARAKAEQQAISAGLRIGL